LVDGRYGLFLSVVESAVFTGEPGDVVAGGSIEEVGEDWAGGRRLPDRQEPVRYLGIRVYVQMAVHFGIQDQLFIGLALRILCGCLPS
jgi:hypothetical protein